MAFPMKLTRLIAATALAVAAAPAIANAEVKLSDFGPPAMLIVTSAGATVARDGDNTILSLKGVHPLVIISFDVHEDRYFDGYPLTDFAPSYNSCNEMKEAYDLWHEDGANTLFAFQNGPDNGEKASHRKYSPLVTAPNAEDLTRVTGTAFGTVPLFVETAEYDERSGGLLLMVAGHNLALGDYNNVVVKLECTAKDAPPDSP